MRYVVGFVLFVVALGVVRLVGCSEGEELPNSCKYFEDETPCLSSRHPDVETTCLDGVCGAAELCWEDKCICYRDPCAWNGWCGTSDTSKCDDENPCTSDECDPDTGACSYPPEHDGTSCCFEWEYQCPFICWNPSTCCRNVCIGGWSTCQQAECCEHGKRCDDGDGNQCTYGVCPACRSLPEDDGTVCDFGEIPGVCVGGVCGENLCKDVVCEGGDACTDYSCDYQDGMCKFKPASCDDTHACTEDLCDPVSGCFWRSVEDGTACGLGSSFGMCIGGDCVAACDPTAAQAYQCPVKGLENLLCCPGSNKCAYTCDVGAFEVQP
jgi:hypothetical protein